MILYKFIKVKGSSYAEKIMLLLGVMQKIAVTTSDMTEYAM